MLLFSVSIVIAVCCWIPLLCQPCTPLVLLYRSGSMSLVDPLHTAASTSQTFINLLFNSFSDPLNTLTYRTINTISIMALLVSYYTCTYALHLMNSCMQVNSIYTPLCIRLYKTLFHNALQNSCSGSNIVFL
jgi:hypothetical protein